MNWTIVKSNELTQEEKIKARTIIKYPKINHTIIAERDYHKYHHVVDPFFGIPLTIEVKRDGSNLRLIYFGKDRYGLLSRNQYAADNFIKKVEEVFLHDTKKYKMLLAVIRRLNAIIFMELFGKGNSPCGFDKDSPPSVEVFDIYLPDLHRWVPRKGYDKSLPTVPLVTIARADTREDYAEWIKKCLKYCDDNDREGVVIKGEHPILGRIMTKEKVAKALEKPKKQPKEPKSKLPVLNISEIMGAVDKAYQVLGEKIWEKSVAMPKVAEYIKEECSKHNCSSPHNYYQYYLKYLEGIRNDK